MDYLKAGLILGILLVVLGAGLAIPKGMFGKSGLATLPGGASLAEYVAVSASSNYYGNQYNALEAIKAEDKNFAEIKTNDGSPEAALEFEHAAELNDNDKLLSAYIEIKWQAKWKPYEKPSVPEPGSPAVPAEGNVSVPMDQNELPPDQNALQADQNSEIPADQNAQIRSDFNAGDSNSTAPDQNAVAPVLPAADQNAPSVGQETQPQGGQNATQPDQNLGLGEKKELKLFFQDEEEPKAKAQLYLWNGTTYLPAPGCVFFSPTDYSDTKCDIRGLLDSGKQARHLKAKIVLTNRVGETEMQIDSIGYIVEYVPAPPSATALATLQVFEDGIWFNVPGCTEMQVPQNQHEIKCDAATIISTRERAQSAKARLEITNQSGNATTYVDEIKLGVDYSYPQPEATKIDENKVKLPLAEGAFEVRIVSSAGEVSSASILFYDENGGLVTNPQKGASYTAKIVFPGGSFASMQINDLNMDQNVLTIGIDDVNAQGLSAPPGVEFTRAFAINPEGMNFNSATVTGTADSNELYKCREWDYNNEACNGSWELIQTTAPGQDYNLEISQADPGFAFGKPKETGPAKSSKIKIRKQKSKFKSTETPKFEFDLTDDKNIAIDKSSADITAYVVSEQTNETFPLPAELLTQTAKGQYSLQVTDVPFKTGRYKVVLDVNDNGKITRQEDWFDWRANLLAKIKKQKEQFRASESPKFEIDLGDEQNIAIDKNLTDINARLIYDPTGEVIPLPADALSKTAEGKFVLNINKRSFRAGKYRISVDVNDDGEMLHQEDWFKWGLIAANTYRSTYSPGDRAKFEIAVLNNISYGVCGPNLEVTMVVTEPGGGAFTYTRSKGQIADTNECGVFTAEHTTASAGTYLVSARAIDASKNVDDAIDTNFLVAGNYDFDIVRTALTKIDPAKPQAVQIDITPKVSLGVPEYTVVERVPAEFTITGDGINPAPQVQASGNEKVLTWVVSNGASARVGYSYSVPTELKPWLYYIGPVEIVHDTNTSYFEARPWQIAVDDVVTFGIVCPYSGTNASVSGLTGWTREASLDGFYVKGALNGADSDMTDSNGASTHTHTAPSTTIVQNSHTHNFSAAAASLSTAIDTGTGKYASSVTHTHGATPSNAATATNQATTPTINANSSNDLNYVTVIWIKSIGTPTGLPQNALAFYSSDSLPSGWNRADNNLYLKGAAAGADAGTLGGANTHTHTGTIQPTQDAHSHTAKNSSGGTGTFQYATGVTNVSKSTHVHSVSLDSNTATNQLDTNTTNGVNHEPPYAKFNIIQNTGSTDLPTGTICIWNGTDANIPANWTRVHDLDTKFVKGANVNGDSNVETGGSSTHTHDINFLVTQNASSHNATSSDNGLTVGTDTVNLNGTAANLNHTHAWTVTFTTATSVLKTVTVNASTAESAYPPYKQVIFIQYNGAAAPSNTKPVVYNGTTIKVDSGLSGYLGAQNSQSGDDNHHIQFQTYDADSNYLGAKIAYSAVKGAFTTQIIDMNLSKAKESPNADYNCSGGNSGLDWRALVTCFADWNTSLASDGNYFVDVNVYDNGGLNDTNSSANSFMADKTAPATTDDHNAGAQTTDANVHLTCNDGSGSGCSSTKYRKYVQGQAASAWFGYGGASDANILFSASSDGNWRLDYNSTDRAGNIEAMKSAWVALTNLSFALGLPSSGCSQYNSGAGTGGGCSTVSCTACTYAHYTDTNLQGGDANQVAPVGQTNDIAFFAYDNQSTATLQTWQMNIDYALGTNKYRNKVSTINTGYQAECTGNTSTGCIYVEGDSLVTIATGIGWAHATTDKNAFLWADFIHATGTDYTDRVITSTSSAS